MYAYFIMNSAKLEISNEPVIVGEEINQEFIYPCHVNESTKE